MVGPPCVRRGLWHSRSLLSVLSQQRAITQGDEVSSLRTTGYKSSCLMFTEITSGSQFSPSLLPFCASAPPSSHYLSILTLSKGCILSISPWSYFLWSFVLQKPIYHIQNSIKDQLLYFFYEMADSLLLAQTPWAHSQKGQRRRMRLWLWQRWADERGKVWKLKGSLAEFGTKT